MEKKKVSGIMLIMFLTSMLMFAIKVQPVEASVDWWSMFHPDWEHTGY